MQVNTDPVTASALRSAGVEPEQAERIAYASKEARKGERSPMAALGGQLPTPSGSALEPSDDYWSPLAKRQRCLDAVRAQAPMFLLGDELTTDTKKRLRGWDPRSGICIFGETGDGKSAAAVHLLARWLRWGEARDNQCRLVRSTMWVRADVLIQAGNQDTGTAEGRELLDRAGKVKLLFLDDVARSTTTLNTVLQLRYDRKKATVLTSGSRNEQDFCKRTGGEALLRWVIDAGQGQGFCLNMWGQGR